MIDMAPLRVFRSLCYRFVSAQLVGVQLSVHLGRAEPSNSSSNRSRGLLSELSAVLITCAVACVFLLSQIENALADDPVLPPPPVHSLYDSNGVNLSTGLNWVDGPSISVGRPDQGGLTYQVHWEGGPDSTGYWQGNYNGRITQSTIDTSQYTVVLMSVSYSFTKSGSVFTPNDGNGETLNYNGTSSTYTLTMRDGTVAILDGSLSLYCPDCTLLGYVETMTYPSGIELTFTWKLASYYYLASITNNLGYQIKVFADGTVYALNNAIDYCNPSADSCTFSQTWPKLSFHSTEVVEEYYYSLTTTVTDLLGNVTTGKFIDDYTAPFFQEQHQITFPSGRYLHFDFEPSSNTVAQVYDASITSTPWTYDFEYSYPDSLWAWVTDPLGHVRWVYSDFNTGAITSDTLFPNGTANPGLTTTYTYSSDLAQRLTDITFPESNSLHYTYDSRGNITEVDQIAKPSSGTATVSMHASFDSSCSNPVTCNKANSITDANSNETDYTYDSTHGGVLTATSPAVGGGRPQTRYTYAAKYAWYQTSSSSGIVAAATSVYKLTQTSNCMAYNGAPVWGAPNWGAFNWTAATSCSGTAKEIITSTSYPTGSSSAATNLLPDYTTVEAGDSSVVATTHMTYDVTGLGNIVTSTDPNGNATAFFYDADRNNVGVVRPEPAGSSTFPAVKTSYSPDGPVSAVEQGTAISQAEADWGSFTSLTQETTLYDANTGAKVRDTYAIGGTAQSVTQYSYDAARNPLCIAVREDSSVFGSLPGACTQSTMAANDQITQNHYDQANRLTSVVAGWGSGSTITQVTNTYTDNSKLATTEDGNGNQSSYTYDGLDRLAKLYFPSKTAIHTPSTTDYEQYGYDNNGNQTSVRLRSGETTTYSYDALNRRIFKDISGGTASDVYYGYDLVGNPLYAHFASTTGYGIDYASDALGRKTSETSSGSGYSRTVASQYDLNGNRTRLTFPDSNYIQYFFDNNNRMTGAGQNCTTCSSYLAQYTYDGLSRETGITRPNGANTTMTYGVTSTACSGGSNTQSWCLAHAGSMSPAVTFMMNYTPSGQVHQRDVSNSVYAYGVPATSTNYYCPNGLNQYNLVGGSGSTCSGGMNYTYDPRGNLTCVSSASNCTGTVATSYSYDTENHLTAVSGSASVSVSYDAVGRMQQTVVSSTTEQYCYDGNSLIVEYDGSGNVLRRYVPGKSVDETLVWYEGSGLSSPHWLHLDQQGSVIAATDGSGTATSYSYSASGEPGGGWGSSPPTPIFRFTGQAVLPAAKLYYYKARFYDPGLGRFLQADPAGYSAALNLYMYAGNDPVNYSDPLGLDADNGCTESDTGTDCKVTGYRPLGSFILDSFVPFVVNPIDGMAQLILTLPPRILPSGTNSPSSVCKGPRFGLGGGVSTTGFLGILGLSGGLSADISIPSGSAGAGSLRGLQVSVSGSITPLAGFGLFAGAGPNYSGGGYSSAKSWASGSATTVLQAGVGDGEGVEFSSAYTWPPNFGVAMGRLAGGAYGAIGKQFSGTLSTTPIGCR